MQEDDQVISSTSTEETTKAGEAAAPADPSSALAALASERDKLVAENSELQDRLLRRQAEFENFRKRAQREREQYLEFAGAEVMLALLPVLDDFERALKTECGDAEYARGIGLIYQRLMEAVKKLGLEPLEAVGAKFDPNLHHAVDRIQSVEAEEDTIVEELQRGYNYRGRLLRPAMVRVACKG